MTLIFNFVNFPCFRSGNAYFHCTGFVSYQFGDYRCKIFFWDRSHQIWCLPGVGTIRMWKTCQGTAPGIRKNGICEIWQSWEKHLWPARVVFPEISPMFCLLWGVPNSQSKPVISYRKTCHKSIFLSYRAHFQPI